MLVTVGCAAACRLHRAIDNTVQVAYRFLRKTTFATQEKKKKTLHATLMTLNGPSKVLTATDGQQIKLTANYISRFNHVIGKLPGHGHGRPSKTVK